MTKQQRSFLPPGVAKREKKNLSPFPPLATINFLPSLFFFFLVDGWVSSSSFWTHLLTFFLLGCFLLLSFVYPLAMVSPSPPPRQMACANVLPSSTAISSALLHFHFPTNPSLKKKNPFSSELQMEMHCCKKRLFWTLEQQKRRFKEVEGERGGMRDLFFFCSWRVICQVVAVFFLILSI